MLVAKGADGGVNYELVGQGDAPLALSHSRHERTGQMTSKATRSEISQAMSDSLKLDDGESVPSLRGNATKPDSQARQSAVLRLIETTAPNAVNETKRPKRLPNVERRASELADLCWGDVRWEERKIMVRRLKGSASGEHPLTEQGQEVSGAVAWQG